MSLYDKGSKAMFSLLRKARNLQSPNDLHLSNMIYGELGVIPIYIPAKCRLLNFWANGTECKLSNIFYYLLFKMDEPAFFTSNWIIFVKNNLNVLGFSEMYTTQNIGDLVLVRRLISQKAH